MSRGKKIGLGVAAGFLALIVIGSLGDSNKDNTSSSSSSQSGTTSRTIATAPTAAVPPTTTEPTKPLFSPAQENAIAKAQSYLSFTGFSKQGLIQQLEFDQFSTGDATFAVEQLEADGEVDWNEQAVKKAKSYLGFTSFSLSGLVTQLEFDGFTPREAEYGANTAYSG